MAKVNHHLFFETMNRIKNSSLEELLELSNYEILDTQVWFAIVVWKYETCTWNEAQRLASQLMKSNTAWEYLEDMRRHVGVFPKEISSHPVATPPKPSKIEKRESSNAYSEPIGEFNPEQIFKENYELLNMLIPDLETEILTFQPGHRLEGKSANNIYGFVSLNCNEKDKRGYYLSLGINEASKSSITMLLFYDIKNQDLLTLSYEDSNGKFEVYNEIHTREMTNLSQEEALNLFLNNKLKKLIGYRLLISNLDLVDIEPLEEKKEIEEEPELRQGRFSRALGRFIPRPVNTTDYSKMIPVELDTEDDEFNDPDEEELKEQIELQNEEIRELQEENEQIKNTALKNLFSNNMKLLRVLVPNLMESLELESFTTLFKSNNEEFPVFKLHFSSVDTGFLCQLYELDPRNNVPQKLATLAILEAKEMVFIDNSREFFGLKEPINTGIYDEYSPLTVQGNNATFNWLIVLLLNQYHSSIIDPVYRAEVVENQLPEIPDKPNDSDGANEAGTILAILGTIGLTILGVKAFNK